jgi:hypothetical protein
MFSFLLFIIFLVCNLEFIGILLWLIGICIIVILLMRIVCPKCKTKLQVGHSYFSRFFTGYHPFLSKKCLKCGYHLDVEETK